MTANPKELQEFARLVLDTPSPVIGEVMGMKLHASPLLEGSGMSIMGYPNDPNPRNFVVLVHGDPKS